MINAICIYVITMTVTIYRWYAVQLYRAEDHNHRTIIFFLLKFRQVQTVAILNITD